MYHIFWNLKTSIYWDLSHQTFKKRKFKIQTQISARNNPLTSPTAIVPVAFVGLITGGSLLSSRQAIRSFTPQSYEMPAPGRRKLLSSELGGPPFFYGYYDMVSIPNFSFQKIQLCDFILICSLQNPTLIIINLRSIFPDRVGFHIEFCGLSFMPIIFFLFKVILIETFNFLSYRKFFLIN